MEIDDMKIDWKMLRRQKFTLLSVLSSGKLNDVEERDLTGILHLIDGVQDGAVQSGEALHEDFFGNLDFEEVVEKMRGEFVGKNLNSLSNDLIHAYDYAGICFVVNDQRDIVDVIPGDTSMDVEWLDEENEIAVFIAGES